MPEDIRFLPQSKLMTAKEIGVMAKIFTGLGVNKIRLTGGEPLLRADFREVLQELTPLGAQLGITTNGVKLLEYLDDLRSAGIQTLNISLDSLRPERVLGIARRDVHGVVWQGIERALEAGFRVKLNMVVMQDVNSDEIPDFISLTSREGIHVRLIEFMPFEGNRWHQHKVVAWSDMLRAVQDAGLTFRKMEDLPHETTKSYQVDGFPGTFSVISTVSSPFCGGCNRIRLTAEGKIRNCLFAKSELDLLAALRRGEDITPLILSALALKEKALGGLPGFSEDTIREGKLSPRAMVKIGG
jgi:cyclic pyranopterin phosphate synthase